MKLYISLLALTAIAFTSCTSAYKTGQTPDDVYFSPQREQSEYVAVKDRDDDNRYENSDDYYSDRQLRMKVQNRNQWSDLDEFYYNTDRYSYSYYDGFYGNPWTANSYWNYNYNPYYSGYFNPYYSSYSSIYSPYYSPIIFLGSGNYNYGYTNRPRMYNLNTYNKQFSSNNYITRRVDLNTAPNQSARNSNYRFNNNYNNSRTNAGDYLRNSFNNNSSNSRPSNNTSTSTPSRSSSSSSSGGSAPVRRF